MEGSRFTLADLAEKTNSTLIGDPQTVIDSFGDLASATTNQVSFLSHPRYRQALASTEAGAVFISPTVERPEGKNYLLHDNPSKAFQQLIELLYNPANDASGFDGIHPTAVIHPSASLGDQVHVGPYVVIDRNCQIGNGTRLDASIYLGPGTTIGTDCHLHSKVVVRERCEIGNRVILQPGVIIGSCGFGYITNDRGEHQKLRQVGKVVIEDDVEIGANTTIDRSRFQVTRIGRGTKIDNLVMVGHGVQIGQHCLFAAQTGIAGSTKIGNHCRFGGQVAINGHIEIGDNVSVAGTSGISKSLSSNGIYGGSPAIPIQQHNRISVFIRNIEAFVKRLDKIEKLI